MNYAVIRGLCQANYEAPTPKCRAILAAHFCIQLVKPLFTLYVTNVFTIFHIMPQ